MSTYLDHPGGIIVCDADDCGRKRRNHCSPEEREKWHAEVAGSVVRDLCPGHNPYRTTDDEVGGRDDL